MEYGRLIYGLNDNCKHYFHYRTVQCSFCIDERLSKAEKEGKNPVFKPENLEINLFGISAWGANKYKNSDK